MSRFKYYMYMYVYVHVKGSYSNLFLSLVRRSKCSSSRELSIENAISGIARRGHPFAADLLHLIEFAEIIADESFAHRLTLDTSEQVHLGGTRRVRANLVPRTIGCYLCTLSFVRSPRYLNRYLFENEPEL